MKNTVFDEFDTDERQSFVRAHTDSAERWLRHLVELTLRPKMGPNYITQGPWKKDLIQKFTVKIQSQPAQFTREIDATTFDQLVDIVCHPNHWADFKDALSTAFPDGLQEARTFLTRLQVIRNHVAHVRPCSVRQMEQALCYSNDVADSVKAHFQATGMSKEFYVPTFVSYADSLGNAGHFPPSEYYFRGQDLSTSEYKRLYPGDVLTIELEVDPSFDVASYNVNWYIKAHTFDRGVGRKAVIKITNAHIGQRMEIQFKLKTTNSWHRSSTGDDDVVDIHYRVLPSPP